MAAYDDDSMSSPDPLADSMPSSLMRRMTRSQQTKQFMSLGGASVSPRRQTFALEVGDNRSPQKLFVTVESEQQQQQQAGVVRRRLFASPTPKKTPAQRSGRTTTTTIPLRDADDDEDASTLTSTTPRRRGRPRKYAPTPVPGAATKKRAGTPVRKRTPGRPRKNALPEEAPSEASAQPTPRASKPRQTASKEPASDATIQETPASSRGKRGAKRKAASEEPSSVPASTPKKRGRPRKKPLMEEVQELPEEYSALQAPSPVSHRASPAPLQSDRATSPAEPAENTLLASEGDIWMDTLSNEATPRAAPRSRSFNMSTATADPRIYSPEALRAGSEIDDYAPLIEARDDTPPASSRGASERPELEDEVMLVAKPVSEAASDTMSEANHIGAGRRARDTDTIAQSEEFSMIFMESIRSIHPDASAMNASAEAPNEVGDTTNLFINKTLESIKEGMQSEQGDGSEYGRSDRSASYSGQQDERDDEHEQRASPRSEAPHQGTEQEPELIDFGDDEGINELVEEYNAQERALSHYEAPQHDTEQEPENVEDEYGNDVGELAEGYHIQEPASSDYQPHQLAREQESVHFQDEEQDELVGEHYTEKHASSHYGHPQQITEQEPEYGQDEEEDMAEEYHTQQPKWDADEPELLTSHRRQTPADRRPELSPTRRNSSLMWSGSPRRPKALPLSRQLMSIKAMQSQQSLAGSSPSQAGFSSPSRVSRIHSANPGEDSNLYEDSFSAIPEAVLEAATPRPQRTVVPSPAAHPEPQGKDAAASGVSGATDTIRSDASRMLTPEETPSPRSTEEVAEPKAGSTVVDSDRASARSMSASPSRPSLITRPEQSFLAAQRPVQDEITPVGPPSSPQLPALHDANLHRATQLPDHERRPTLSPIVRAGIALQSVTSDRSSPIGLKTLGSPFKASVNSTPRVGSTQPSRETEKAAPQPLTRQPSNEGPFGPSRRDDGQDSFMRALDESARQLQARRAGQPAPVFDTTRAMLEDADEMSWVAEDTVPAPMAQPDTVASKSPSMAANFGSVAARQNAVDGKEASNAGSDDEEDIWFTEAQRPMPKHPRQEAFGAAPAQRTARRTLIPNTWRRNAQATPAAKTGTDDKADSQLGEYSLLSQKSKEPVSHQGSSAAKPGAPAGVDLSKFFSSPTVLPNLSGAGNPTKNAPANRAAPAPARTLPSNSMFPAVPQKDFQPSPVRRSRLFSSAASESAATSVVEQGSALKPAAPSMAEQVSPSRPAGPSTMDRQASPSKSTGTSIMGQQTAPSTPDRSLPDVEQKQNFTPRRGHGSKQLFAPSSARSSAPTPPQMQLSRNDIARWQAETSRVLDQPSDSPEAERLPVVQLPHRTMSPSKSCLRSPLKPRTPGRVVEFAGAVSPLQQAQARAAKANARRAAPVQFVPPQQPKPVQSKPPRPIVLEEDKENTPSDVETSDSPQKAPLPEGLSQKVWGKDHWRLLDTLIQLRRRGPFPFDLAKAGYVRRERGLAGRVAAAGGQSMEIEGWHVDVVDAFRAEVGGWDEAVLAKRVFALVVGERRRGM